MKSRPTQFGLRENTASSRQHAPRLTVDTGSRAVRIEDERPDIQRSSPLNDPQTTVSEKPLYAASQRAVTGDGERDVPEGSADRIPGTRLQKSEQSFEPLLGSPEAAKLLGNIHERLVSNDHKSQSEQDWAYAKRALGRGDDPEVVIQRIADYRADDKCDSELLRSPHRDESSGCARYCDDAETE
jgi:hypothetical protein